MGKGGRCVGLTTFICLLSRNVGASNSWNPQGLSRPVMGLLYLAFIIIIIWHYNPLWFFAFSAKSLQVLLSLAISFQFFTFSFFRSSKTSFCHRCLGLPTGLVPIGFQSSSFLVGLALSILWICPSHLIRCALMNLTISAPSVKLSISMSFRILHTLSILTLR